MSVQQLLRLMEMRLNLCNKLRSAQRIADGIPGCSGIAAAGHCYAGPVCTLCCSVLTKC